MQPSLSQHVILVLWAQLLVIVAAARLFGSLVHRMGQPKVVGELLAGLVLGPSVVGKLWPAGSHWLLPSDPAAAAPLNTVAHLGVAFLLLLTGFETDLQLIRRQGRVVAYVAIGAMVLPFTLGLIIAPLLPEQFVGPNGGLAAFVLFVAVSMTISSLPVIAKVLDELGYMRRSFAQITIAVGMVNDLVGWLALGFVAALVRAGSLPASKVVGTLIAMAAVLALVFTVGRVVVDRVLRVVARGRSSDGPLTASLLITFLFAVIMEIAHTEAVLGAYFAGIILGRSRFQNPRVRGQIEAITSSVLAPVFFATVGLRIDVTQLCHTANLMWGGIVLAVAIVSKVSGAFIGARLGRLCSREGVALGVGLNARGAVEIVIATAGMSLGILSSAAYAVITLMAVVTSVMAPPLLRAIVGNWRGSPAEQQRLAREHSLKSNILVRSGRLLLPDCNDGNSSAVARLMHLVWPREVGVTTLSFDNSNGTRGWTRSSAALSRMFDGREVQHRRLRGAHPQAVAEESRWGYSAIGLDAEDAFIHGPHLSPLAGHLLAHGHVPLVILRHGAGTNAPSFRRILVPVAGTAVCRTAQELAVRLAYTTGAEMLLLHVVNSTDGREPAAEQFLQNVATVTTEYDVHPRNMVRCGKSVAGEILTTAVESHADLIVLGASVRQIHRFPSFSHTVEYILQQAACAVVVISTPLNNGYAEVSLSSAS